MADQIEIYGSRIMENSFMPQERGPIKEYFIINESDQSCVCKLPPNSKLKTNGVCGYYLKKYHNGNLAKHLRKDHPTEHEALKRKLSEIADHKQQLSDSIISAQSKQMKLSSNLEPKLRLTVEFSLSDLENAGIAQVTKAGRPFSSINDAGFQMLLKPYYNALENENIKYKKVTPYRVKNLLATKSENLQEKIRKLTKNRVVSLKTDCASYKNRSFIGVNIQFYADEKFHLITLGCVEVTTQHTADNLLEIIKRILDNFNIPMQRIYSITTDNGANFVKSVRLFDEEVKDKVTGTSTNSETVESDGDIFDEIDEIDEIEISEVEVEIPTEEPNAANESNTASATFDITDISPNEDLLDEIETVWNNVEVLTAGVIGIRCAAHSMQLAVGDSFKDCSTYADTIARAKAVVVKLRTPTLARELRKYSNKLPILDCTTRWMSTYDLLVRLKELSEAIHSMSGNRSLKDDDIAVIRISNQDWTRIDHIIDALAPTKKATVKLQYAKLDFCEFYKIWCICTIETRKIGNDFAKAHVVNLDLRKEKLFSNMAFLSALFLHKNYRAELNANQQEDVIAHLISLLPKFETSETDVNNDDETRAANTTSTNENLMDEDDDVNEDDPAEIEFMAQLSEKANQRTQMTSSSTQKDELKKEIEAYLKEPSFDRKTMPNMITFWYSKKNDFPLLSMLAIVIYCTPCTQCSVERLFSHLSFILDPHRLRLKGQNVNDIILVRNNESE